MNYYHRKTGAKYAELKQGWLNLDTLAVEENLNKEDLIDERHEDIASLDSDALELWRLTRQIKTLQERVRILLDKEKV